MKFSLIMTVLLLWLSKYTAADLTKKWIQITRSWPAAGQEIRVLKAGDGVSMSISNRLHQLSAWGSSSALKLNQLPQCDGFVVVCIKWSDGLRSVSPTPTAAVRWPAGEASEGRFSMERGWGWTFPLAARTLFPATGRDQCCVGSLGHLGCESLGCHSQRELKSCEPAWEGLKWQWGWLLVNFQNTGWYS